MGLKRVGWVELVGRWDINIALAILPSPTFSWLFFFFSSLTIISFSPLSSPLDWIFSWEIRWLGRGRSRLIRSTKAPKIRRTTQEPVWHISPSNCPSLTRWLVYRFSIHIQTLKLYGCGQIRHSAKTQKIGMSRGLTSSLGSEPKSPKMRIAAFNSRSHGYCWTPQDKEVKKHKVNIDPRPSVRLPACGCYCCTTTRKPPFSHESTNSQQIHWQQNKGNCCMDKRSRRPFMWEESTQLAPTLCRWSMTCLTIAMGPVW